MSCPMVASDGHTYDLQSLLRLVAADGSLVGVRSPMTREAARVIIFNRRHGAATAQLAAVERPRGHRAATVAGTARAAAGRSAGYSPTFRRHQRRVRSTQICAPRRPPTVARCGGRMAGRGVRARLDRGGWSRGKDKLGGARVRAAGVVGCDGPVRVAEWARNVCAAERMGRGRR